MKRFLALTLVILMAWAALGGALAELDLSSVRERTELYTLDVDTDDDVAFIETQLSTKDRSFVHKYESEARYNSTKFDILVVEYLKTASSYPVMRLWITYCADDDFMNINSASFVFDDKKFTFSGIADSDWYVHDDDGYVEQVLIKFGMDNIDFLVYLEDLFDDVEDYGEATAATSCKLILHGREDVEADLGEGFFLDFLAIKMAFVEIGGLDYLDKANASTMKVVDLE